MIFRSNFPDVDIEKIGIYQFITIGFKHGDVLAICSHNHIDYPVVIFGAIAAGGIVTTVNPGYEYEEFASQLKDCGASVIICHPVYLSKTIEAAKAANIHESKIFLFDENKIQGLQPFLSLFSNQEINPVEYTPEEAESTTAYLCYSSDQINHENVYIGTLPFFHIYGLTLLVHFVIIKGASCVILRKFELETFCRTIQDYKVNIAPITPPIVLLLVNNPIARNYDLSSLKLAISSAAPLSKDLCKKFVEIYKAPIKQGYGLTETTPFAIVTKTDNIVDGSIGILIPNVECKIISENNQELEYDEEGEFCIRGPNVMKGYLNNKEATDASYVELKPDEIQSDELKEEIKDFVSQKVPPYKKLHCVHFVDKIPKNSASKTLRRSLRAKNECVKQCLL
ncbi:acetyl-CoA synthetase-like protein [Rhizophagus irregularis]|uniref:Acetyl-CoA synthetase-like protein n=1 Tax=Rhizophagus irregularis TaxID=588596 RepID=A0A2I1HD93_9GLOM|nr:acetyl-CoA synthetase-like protein [Rhizophagus irregularis]